MLSDNEIFALFRANCVHYLGNYEVTPGQALQIAKHLQGPEVPEAWTNLLAYVLQDELHNRLTPRVIDIAYTAFMQAKRPNTEDGGPSDWFNDTRPMVRELIAKLRKALIEELDGAPQPSPTPQADSVTAPAEPDKADPRKFQLQGIILALTRLSCVPPMSPALEHQLERLAAFYFDNGDENFAQKLVLLKRGAFANGRRSVLVPSAAPTPPAQAADSVLEDAARWNLLPAFIEKYQIDYIALLRDIDAARKQGNPNG